MKNTYVGLFGATGVGEGRIAPSGSLASGLESVELKGFGNVSLNDLQVPVSLRLHLLVVRRTSHRILVANIQGNNVKLESHEPLPKRRLFQVRGILATQGFTKRSGTRILRLIQDPHHVEASINTNTILRSAFRT